MSSSTALGYLAAAFRYIVGRDSLSGIQRVQVDAPSDTLAGGFEGLGDEDASEDAVVCASESHHVFSQWVKRAVGCSTQYGKNAYGMRHIVGLPTVYPHYGDRTDTLKLRTYGSWWRTSPSAPPPLSHRPHSFASHDYVDIEFDVSVYPIEVVVYETFNPGAVSRIIAIADKRSPPDTSESSMEDAHTQWQVLWEGDSSLTGADAFEAARKLTLKLKKARFPSKLLRVEFNAAGCHYHPAIDAIELRGTMDDPYTPSQRLQSERAARRRANIVSNPGILSFADLPVEIALHVFLYLDHRDMCRLASVCKFMRALAYDPRWWSDVDLQPFSVGVGDDALARIVESRLCGGSVARMSLSWCSVSEASFASAMGRIGRTLRTLRLANCPFLTTDAILDIDLQGARWPAVAPNAFAALDSLNLRRMNLFDTCVSTVVLVHLARGMSQLSHLNVGQSDALQDTTRLVMVIAGHCSNMRSLCVSRCRGLHDFALMDLGARCPLLEELDIGYGELIITGRGGISAVTAQCHHLRRLCLAGIIRTLSADIAPLVNCSHLVQLDVSETPVDAGAVGEILSRCINLALLDVTFCPRIEWSDVDLWRRAYPSLDIKSNASDLSIDS